MQFLSSYWKALYVDVWIPFQIYLKLNVLNHYKTSRMVWTPFRCHHTNPVPQSAREVFKAHNHQLKHPNLFLKVKIKPLCRMCRTEQVLLLSDDLTSTLIMLINTSFNFGLKIKAFSRGQMLVSSNSFAKNVSYYEFISLFSKLKCKGAQHKWFLWSIYFDF